MTCAEGDELNRLAHLLTWRGPDPSAERFLNLFMDQNNKCNLRCLMCGFSDARVASLPRYDMPRWLFDRIAREVFPRANYVCLSLMTEPFMTRDFSDRLSAVRQFGVPFSEIITNGTLLTAEDCERIAKAEISRVIVSIDGGTAKVFETIRVGARLDHVLANFELLRDVRRPLGKNRALPILRVNHVLSELNIDAFADFLGLMERLKPDEVAVRTISRMSNAVLQESKDAKFWGKVVRIRDELARFCDAAGIRDAAYLRGRHTLIEVLTDSGDKLLCPKPWDTLAIHPNGEAYPCMAWSRPPIGNFAIDPFEAIWNGAPLNTLREEFRSKQAGVDCLHCTIRRGDDDPDDDFFVQKLAKPAVSSCQEPPLVAPGSQSA